MFTWLINALVISRLDYCNSVLFGIPWYQKDKLQKIQNTAVRYMMCSSDVSTIARLYQKNVPWLPVQKTSEFNSLPLTSLQDHKWPVGRLLEASNKSPSSITNYKIRVTFTTLSYQKARTEPFGLSSSRTRPIKGRMSLLWANGSHAAGAIKLPALSPATSPMSRARA